MISIKKGLDLPISGAITDAIIHDIAPQHPVAILGEDYQGLKPTMLVAEGDKVTLGQPLFEDKKNPTCIQGSSNLRIVSCFHTVYNCFSKNQHKITRKHILS